MARPAGPRLQRAAPGGVHLGQLRDARLYPQLCAVYARVWHHSLCDWQHGPGADDIAGAWRGARQPARRDSGVGTSGATARRRPVPSFCARSSARARPRRDGARRDSETARANGLRRSRSGATAAQFAKRMPNSVRVPEPVTVTPSDPDSARAAEPVIRWRGAIDNPVARGGPAGGRRVKHDPSFEAQGRIRARRDAALA